MGAVKAQMEILPVAIWGAAEPAFGADVFIGLGFAFGVELEFEPPALVLAVCARRDVHMLFERIKRPVQPRPQLMRRPPSRERLIGVKGRRLGQGLGTHGEHHQEQTSADPYACHALTVTFRLGRGDVIFSV